MRFHHHPHTLHMRPSDMGAGAGRGRGRSGEGELDGRRGGGRFFSHGGLKFVLLHLLSYSPSPGTVYPTLTMLEEQGYLEGQSLEPSGRKRYAMTDAGRQFLEDNRALADAMLARLNGGVDGVGPRGGRPPQVTRALENLKMAIRLRLSGEALSPEQASAFAAVLDHAAQQLEKI
jgi:DNA-binding PadR family transcriptional regulator